MLENSLRNDLAEQTLLAAQRTFFCWIRTGLSGFGGSLADPHVQFVAHVIATLLLIRFEIGGYQAS